MDQPLVTIGISTYNRSESLRQNSLAAIEKLTYSNYEVIVIDDNSQDETQAILQDYQTKISNFKFFRNSKNQGLCHSRNRILEQSKGDIIVFIDDDVSVFPNCLDEIVNAYAQDPDALFAWGGVYQCHGTCDPNQLTFGSGSLFSMRRIIAQHFRFDTNIHYMKTYGCEEHDFARRVQKAAAKIIRTPAAKANHYQAPAKNRAWRALGGDLNYLYERSKSNSVFEYYQSLLVGLWNVIVQATLNHQSEENTVQNPYKKLIHSLCHQLLIMMRDGQWITAAKCLFYGVVDIPVKAFLQSRIEARQADSFNKALRRPSTV
jgi:glycosyltransferase involved in cell wall biosynthesis